MFLVCNSATAGRDSAVSIGHRLWEQRSNPSSALAVRSWASELHFLHLQIGGSTKPGGACETEVIGLYMCDFPPLTVRQGLLEFSVIVSIARTMASVPP